MKYLYKCSIFILLISLLGCESLISKVVETPEGYEIGKDTNLSVILQTPLGSNINQRGDQFTTKLKESLMLGNKTILPKDTQIKGLVKSVTKYQKLGDRAGLLLLFDQFVLPDQRKLPLAASLDTNQGREVIRIEGKAVKDATIVGGSALVGSLAGRKSGAQKGMLVGAVAGAGVVILSDMREVRLPAGTELIIKLDEKLFIPK